MALVSIIKCVFVILQILLLRHSLVESLSSGAPDSACSSMQPRHGQFAPQTSQAPPYTISPNTSETFGGGRIIVKLESNPDVFKGFLIQARDSQDSPLGRFHTAVHATLSCSGENVSILF